MYIVGIDPGAKGAATIMNIYDYHNPIILRFSEMSLVDIFNSLSEIRGGDVARRAERINPNKLEVGPDNSMEIWLEVPALSPKNGKQSFRYLGERIGEWRGIAAGLALTPIEVSPLKWQNVLKCRTRGNKGITTNRAKSIFPSLVDYRRRKPLIDVEIADSLLIAVYGYLHYVPFQKLPKNLATILEKPLTSKQLCPNMKTDKRDHFDSSKQIERD